MKTLLIRSLITAALTILTPNTDIPFQEVRCTCYLPTGNRTADGTVPYEGIIASNRDHLGDVAVLYSVDGEFIGFFECRDIGGHRKLRNGTAIDVYRDNMDRAWEWVGEWGDYVYIYWIEGVDG